eukprot:365825-Chlamydomonas_euryale.AAC.4
MRGEVRMRVKETGGGQDKSIVGGRERGRGREQKKGGVRERDRGCIVERSRGAYWRGRGRKSRDPQAIAPKPCNQGFYPALDGSENPGSGSNGAVRCGTGGSNGAMRCGTGGSNGAVRCGTGGSNGAVRCGTGVSNGAVRCGTGGSNGAVRCGTGGSNGALPFASRGRSLLAQGWTTAQQGNATCPARLPRHLPDTCPPCKWPWATWAGRSHPAHEAFGATASLAARRDQATDPTHSPHLTRSLLSCCAAMRQHTTPQLPPHLPYT